MPNFSVVDRGSGPYHTPDFSIREERWWDDPLPPTAHSSLDIVTSLMPQVAEAGKNGKQSCFLTSQLNALIVRGQLNTTTATEIQHELVTNDRFSGYWVPYGTNRQLGWASNPYDLAFVLNEDFGLRIGVEHAESAEATQAVRERLQSGYVAILLGKSAVGGHTRLAFETDNTPGQFFVHDPRYPETTGLYNYDRLVAFHTQNRIIAY